MAIKDDYIKIRVSKEQKALFKDIAKKKKLNLFQNIKHILIRKNIELLFLTKEFITISTLTYTLIKLKMNLLK